MYLLCKAIREQTNVKVLLTGEISDELFGYKYTDYAPAQQLSKRNLKNEFASFICMTFYELIVAFQLIVEARCYLVI